MKTQEEHHCHECGADLDVSMPRHMSVCRAAAAQAPLTVDKVRFSLTPSKTYKWCVVAFNAASGLDMTKAVRWYKTRRSAETCGIARFGLIRHLIGRAPL